MTLPDRAAPVRRGVPRPVLRRGHRRAARRDLGRRAGHGRPAPGRRASTPPSSTGPSTRCCSTSRCTVRRHLRARPGRRHRAGRAEPPRHVGHVDRSAGARPARWPRRGTRPGCARRWPGGADRRRAERDPLLQGAGAGRPRRPSTRWTGSTCCCGPSSRGSWSSATARWPAPAWRSASGSPTRASASPSSTRSGRCRSNPALVELAAEHELVITIEDNGVVGGCGARLAQELRRGRRRHADARVRHPQEFLDHGSRAELLEELGLTPQAHRPLRRRGDRRARAERAASHRPEPVAAGLEGSWRRAASQAPVLGRSGPLRGAWLGRLPSA